jgi:hypothetical protein
MRAGKGGLGTGYSRRICRISKIHTFRLYLETAVIDPMINILKHI